MTPVKADRGSKCNLQCGKESVNRCLGRHLHREYWNDLVFAILGNPLRMRAAELFGNHRFAVVAGAYNQEISRAQLARLTGKQRFELGQHLMGSGIADPALHSQMSKALYAM
jgi:hypothetical protein